MTAQNDNFRGRRWPLSIAPMMDWSDRHYRFFMRQITRSTLLYTQMKTTGAVLYGDRDYLLGYSEIEKPLALQLGGDSPYEMAECAKIAEDHGYDEVNINVGCPSDRVQKGRFGACLMARPETVAECVAKMRAVVKIPVTVKHRIGIDDHEEYSDLRNFVNVVSQAESDRFIVHARIAVLSGLNPKENRNIPPLRYADVYRLKDDFPHLAIEINGGIKTIPDIHTQLRYVDGVMLGRAAYEDPYLFAEADSLFYASDAPLPTRRNIVEAMVPYIDHWLAKGVYPVRITRHLMGLFTHQRGARQWRRYLSETVYRPGTTGDVLRKACASIPDEVLDSAPNSRISKPLSSQAV